jgi:hypothetical protein
MDPETPLCISASYERAVFAIMYNHVELKIAWCQTYSRQTLMALWI